MSQECLVFYVIYALLLLLSLVVLAIYSRTHGAIHIHHYFLALVLMPLTAFKNPMSTIVQAFLAGMFVEGVTSWGVEGLIDLKKLGPSQPDRGISLNGPTRSRLRQPSAF